jgi:hypothetical protein
MTIHTLTQLAAKATHAPLWGAAIRSTIDIHGPDAVAVCYSGTFTAKRSRSCAQGAEAELIDSGYVPVQHYHVPKRWLPDEGYLCLVVGIKKEGENQCQ